MAELTPERLAEIKRKASGRYNVFGASEILEILAAYEAQARTIRTQDAILDQWQHDREAQANERAEARATIEELIRAENECDAKLEAAEAALAKAREALERISKEPGVHLWAVSVANDALAAIGEEKK